MTVAPDKHGTGIEWTHIPGTRGQTLNPLRAENIATGAVGWYCEHASDECRFCYSERLNTKPGMSGGTGLAFKPGHLPELKLWLDEKVLHRPLHWREPRTIFVCSMTDLFGRFHTAQQIARVLAMAALCPQHIFIVLTKRAERMHQIMTYEHTPAHIAAAMFAIMEAEGRPITKETHPQLFDEHGYATVPVKLPLPNLWLGVSCGNQKAAEERVPFLMRTPTPVPFVSAEPLIGSIHFGYLGWPSGDTRPRDGYNALLGFRYENGEVVERLQKLAWIITGGESGFNANIRPTHPEWKRSLRDQAAAVKIPFFDKQWGEWAPLAAGERPLRGVQTRTFQDGQVMARVGREKAGHLLDGKEHFEFPDVKIGAAA
ncbi:MAG TPA: DUF5131 family protein [Rhizomicrobium sp.]